MLAALIALNAGKSIFARTGLYSTRPSLMNCPVNTSAILHLQSSDDEAKGS